MKLTGWPMRVVEEGPPKPPSEGLSDLLIGASDAEDIPIAIMAPKVKGVEFDETSAQITLVMLLEALPMIPRVDVTSICVVPDGGPAAEKDDLDDVVTDIRPFAPMFFLETATVEHLFGVMCVYDPLPLGGWDAKYFMFFRDHEGRLLHNASAMSLMVSTDGKIVGGVGILTPGSLGGADEGEMADFGRRVAAIVLPLLHAIGILHRDHDITMKVAKHILSGEPGFKLEIKA